MNARPFLLGGPVLGAGLLALILALSAAPSPARADAPNVPVSTAVSAVSPVPFADAPWYKVAWDSLAHWLSNRGRMIQFGVIGMIIALIIICRNRW